MTRYSSRLYLTCAPTWTPPSFEHLKVRKGEFLSPDKPELCICHAWTAGFVPGTLHSGHTSGLLRAYKSLPVLVARCSLRQFKFKFLDSDLPA